MKTKLLFTILLSCIYFLAFTQVPQGFNYQAVAKDGNSPIANQSLPVRITIQADSLGTSVLWQELHSSVTTNGSGMFTLILGKGSRQAASTVPAFSDINWSISPKFIKTEINYGDWKTLGVTRFWSVPYSLYTANLTGTLSKLAVKGNTAINDEALFEVRNKDGQIVFAVYNEGVRVYVSDGAKGLKGGFAVGGFGTDKAVSTPYFVVGKDSVRVYLDTNPLTKGLKGGFAVGGYDLTKGVAQDYLNVNSDSVRIYIDSNPLTKGLKGGFAVGGYDMTKGTNTNYMNVNTDASGIINPSQNRILWYPIKNAFLTGKVLVESPDSVGVNSFASGYESKAKGQFSQALGFKAIARGDYSTAIGKNAVAGKINSFAFGENSTAANNQTYALGYNTFAGGLGSFALGYNAKAKGQDAFAFGSGTEATGQGSFAIGFIGRDSAGIATGNTKANADWAIAVGMGSQAIKQGAIAIGTKNISNGNYSLSTGYETNTSGWYSTAMGYKTSASGNVSFAIGNQTKASNGSSIAMGALTTASGSTSTAIGFITTASGDFSTAMGYKSTASEECSTALGYDSKATGIYSLATGWTTTASGQASTAMGDYTFATGYASLATGRSTGATGDISTAMGWSSTATGKYSTAMGSYNSAPSGFETSMGCFSSTYTPVSTTGWNGSDRLFNIGNGTSTARSDAFTILKNGNVGIGTNFPASKLVVYGGDIRILSMGYGIWLRDETTGTNWQVHSHGDVLRMYNGSVETIVGTQTSSLRWKDSIKPLENMLEKINQLQGVTFTWKTGYGKGGNDLGFIAEEVGKIFPELVTYEKNGVDAVTLNYPVMSAIAIEGIKELSKKNILMEYQIANQQKEIESYKSENDNLKSQLQTLQEKVDKIETFLAKSLEE